MTRETGITRLVGVLRRHTLAVLATAIVAAGAGLFVVKKLTPQFQARAVVRIDDPHPSKDYVAPAVTEPELERLKSARMGFLAAPLVDQAGRRVGLISGHDNDLTYRRAMGLLTARLDARLEGTDTYVLTFNDTNPARAQAFLAALIEGYVVRRAEEMTTRAKGLADYFEKEIDRLRPLLADKEAQVERFRLEHYGSLPEQLDANLRVLEETQMQTHTLATSVDMAEGRRREILAEAISPIRHQEEEVAKNVSAARMRYSADAPEVKALEGELERVRADRMADEEGTSKKIKQSVELRNVDDQIARYQAQIVDLRARGDELRKKIDEAAKNGEQLARLSLDRDVLRERLHLLIGKQQDAGIAAGMEAGVEGRARVSILEPAWTLANPVKPAKMLLGLGVLLAALLLGLGVGFGLDALERRVRAADDVHALLGDVPILGVVPHIDRRGTRVNGFGHKGVNHELV